MSHYTHLSMKERCLLTTFLSMKLSLGSIAKRMGRHRSTLYRELARNGDDGYMPRVAHARANERHPQKTNKLDEDKGLQSYVREGLSKGWSPEQISGRMKKDNVGFYVCPESIYRYIYSQKEVGLFELLPSKRKKRHSRKGRKTGEKRLQMAKRNICHRDEDVIKSDLATLYHIITHKYYSLIC